jgi:1-deoxy-D-xylulose-5-phosphate reductoisomerase
VVRDVIVVGSTGSIGTQALDVVARNPDRFRVTGLASGGGDPAALAEQVAATGATVVAVADPARAGELRERLAARVAHPVTVLSGPTAAAELAAGPGDVVLNAMPGSVGLGPTLAALDAGHVVALANKESLVAGGPLVKARARPGQLVAVDSEHSALAQCLRAGRPEEVAALVLTASGGPFRGWSRARLADVTPAQALAHPTWQMGPLVTINSATLVNKGLETIEAHLLFDLPYPAIDVVVHPQSLVHSLVTFTDGSTLAQLSRTDMRLPIALALGWPDRVPAAVDPLPLTTTALCLEFEPLDHDAFPAVQLARRAGQAGGVSPAVFNAANEECVAAFLAGRLAFTAIVDTIAAVLDELDPGLQDGLTLADVMHWEGWARRRALELVEGQHP